ncbi:MFS transporter [Umezawaea sp. Da 62-37]|uniref:MFS transporter n=1 Tax=Umezawaea sp. Da 62-37 TaxID=3075927 RepID=UPI0028F6C5AF|nr:MFS transporter [Umezawaea sp. Da 62-37]WNV88642.1 MFS transporter [Umezawaea sp. Da 62-37]
MTSVSTEQPSTAVRGPRALTPTLVYIGLLIAVVSSLGAPLIPTVAVDYDVSLGSAQWSVTLTLLVGALASPVVGKLGDGPRRRQVLLTALAVLLAGSVLAAFPLPFALMLAGRAMQGVGLALLPLLMSVARDNLEPERARAAVATLSVTAVVGIGLGYPLMGLIAGSLGFHAGFWLAAALGVVALALVAVVVPPSGARVAKPFDLVGTVLLGPGIACLLVGLSEGPVWGWASPTTAVAFAVAVVLLAVWFRRELRTPYPLVNLGLMRNPSVLAANATGLVAGIGMYMLMSMVIRYVQTPTSVSYGLGAPVVVAGLVLVPMSVCSFAVNMLVGRLGTGIGPRVLLPTGVGMFAVALLLFAVARSHLWEMFVVMGFAGLGTGLVFAVLPRMVVAGVPLEETSSGLAMHQVLRTVGYSVGSALSATILTAWTVAPSRFPENGGYKVGAFVAIGLCVVAAVGARLLQSRPVPRVD